MFYAFKENMGVGYWVEFGAKLGLGPGTNLRRVPKTILPSISSLNWHILLTMSGMYDQPSTSDRSSEDMAAFDPKPFTKMVSEMWRTREDNVCHCFYHYFSLHGNMTVI
jgi:hypothetical protein